MRKDAYVQAVGKRMRVTIFSACMLLIFVIADASTNVVN